MTTYAFRSPSGDIVAMYPKFSPPRPLHALTPEAAEAVESVRRLGEERRAEAAPPDFVTDVGNPAPEPYEAAPGFSVKWATGETVHVVTGAPQPLDPVTAAARRLLALADSKGFTTQLLTTHESCTVEGHHPSRVGFRAIWHRGASSSATWHTPWKCEEIDDNRPIGIDSRSKTGKVGYRSPGMGTRRMSIVGTPWGISIGITALTARLRALDEG